MANNETAVVSPGKKLIVGSGYSYLALLINKAAGVATSIFLARTLGPTNLGMISIINYLLLLLLFFTGFGIPTACVKLISEYETRGDNSQTSRFIVIGFLLNLVLIITLSALYLILASTLALKIYQEPQLIPLIQLSVIALFFFSFNQYGNSIIQGLAEFKKLSLLATFTSVFGLIALVPLTKIWGIKGPVLAQGINSIVSFFILVKVIKTLQAKHGVSLYISRQKIKDFLKPYFQRLSRTAIPIFLSGLVMTPALTILTAILARQQGFTEVGFFNIAYSLTQFILFVPSAVGTAFIPLATKLALENRERLNSFLLKSIYGVDLIVVTITFLISLFSREIIYLVYGSEFLPAQNILILLSAAAFLSSFGYIFGYYLIAVNKLWFATGLNFLWFIAIIGPALIFIKYFKLDGLGLNYIISYTILGIVILIYIWQKIRVRMKPLVSHLIGGMIFLIALYLMKAYSVSYIFQLILLPFFGLYLWFFLRVLLSTGDKNIIKNLLRI
ncbi:MAG: oligosaccharide flippase family protein [Candidatus Latescibacteria bacterium]|nr:oligosaccharide flippase family protein [Candidatus Latescibacterota bacterium]